MAEQKAQKGEGSELKFDDGAWERNCRWKAPPYNSLKFNFHGVFSRKNCSAGVCVVVRNDLGELVDGVSLRQSASSSIEAEAKAAVKASEMAQVYSDKKIVFEGESVLLIQSIVDCSVVTANLIIYALVEGIKANCKSIGDFSWVVCKKRSNLAAAHIASMLTETDVFSDVSWISNPPPSWVKDPPQSLREILFADMH